MITCYSPRARQNKKTCLKEVFGTKEWAEYSENIINGCIHNCKYCYSKEMAIRFKRTTVSSWVDETLRSNVWNKKITLKSGRIMFPSSHDIHPMHLEPIVAFLRRVLEVGNDVLIVTKPHFECINKICSTFLEYRSQILFRFTIGSINNEALNFWEPGAPCFEERLTCLEHAYLKGYETSVSCEPALDNDVSALIIKLLPFITNSIWIGKPNMFLHRLKINGHSDEETLIKATGLLEQLSDQFFIQLYREYQDNSVIKWKESVKKLIGLNIPVVAGLDI